MASTQRSLETTMNAAVRPFPPVTGAIDFWGELDGAVLRCLSDHRGELSPAEVGDRVGISEGAARSILMMLAETGRVRICSVASVPDPSVV
jgi:IclR-like helix-turn-helix domain-containing protein